jgi:hypothetical protein
VIVCSDELRPVIEHNLHNDLTTVLTGSVDADLGHAPVEEIAGVVGPVIERADRDRERDLIATLQQALGTGGPAAAGLDDVLSSLEQQRVETLLVPEHSVRDLERHRRELRQRLRDGRSRWGRSAGRCSWRACSLGAPGADLLLVGHLESVLAIDHDLAHSAFRERKHRCAAYERLDHHQSERLSPADRHQQCLCACEQLLAPRAAHLLEKHHLLAVDPQLDLAGEVFLLPWPYRSGLGR